jgi:very-short-patch-repair endonuclease
VEGDSIVQREYRLPSPVTTGEGSGVRAVDESDGPLRIGRLESSRELRERAREFRRSLTPSEERLWTALRDRRFRGLKFRRQRPTGPFIADFYCAELGLVVEVDGTMHDEPEVPAHDALRDEWLGNRRMHVLRLSTDQIMGDLTKAMRRIGGEVDAIRAARESGKAWALTPGPSPAGAGEGSLQ